MRRSEKSFRFSIIILSLLLSTSTASATIQCNECHGGKAPADYRPIDNSYRNVTTGGFKGNHRTHMDSSATAATCAKCHPGSGAYQTAHRSGFIDISSNINGSYLKATYRNGTTAIKQTATPRLGSCANVNCHFETATPVWGSNPYNSADNCSACHSAPGPSVSHTRHNTYFSFNDNGCVKCHPDYKTGLKFYHATSAGHAGRGIRVVLGEGSYSGNGLNYLTSQSGLRTFGNCANSYCHSSGTSISTGSIPANSTGLWGSGSLTCTSCHDTPPGYPNGSPKANSHLTHAAHTITDCSICHYGTTNNGTTISDTTKHVNKVYNVEPKPGYTFSYTNNAAGGSCTSLSCHANAQWGSGGAGATVCMGCHGHSAGYEYEAGKFSQGKGSWRSHATHTQMDGSNARGPNITCGGCHDTNNFPYFKTGTDANNDGKYSLSETDVCNTCHSPGGTYDGVNNSTYGAKANWKFSIYTSGIIRSGKEKWCASCHDEVASTISGVSAPNVVGSESGSYSYGNGWGFYKTGHGLPNTQTYPASGGLTAGAGVECSGCHDTSLAHIDAKSRTFDCTIECNEDEYRNGYRLKTIGIDQQNPMKIPLLGGTVNSVDQFRLCYSCHNSDIFFDIYTGVRKTNFVSKAGVDGTQNRHKSHLSITGTPSEKYAADYRTNINSRITCVICHNVHGSTRLAMVNDGKLINKEPGLKIWYYNQDLVALADPPNPPSLPLTLSYNADINKVGGHALQYPSSDNLCGNCHGAPPGMTTEKRTPFQNAQQPPSLSWTGEIGGYENDGVNPDNANGGSIFTFRVKYKDTNNDPPVLKKVWIDINSDGYEDGNELFEMQAADGNDNSYFDGKIYTYSTSLVHAGQFIHKYAFRFTDANAEATGEPALAHDVTVNNAIPVLSWTGETNYQSSGVFPNPGATGTNFAFRVKYTDLDNEAPSTINLRIDTDNNGNFETIPMTRDSAVGDGDYRNGEIYKADVVLTYQGSGVVRYYFEASDGISSSVEEAGPLSQTGNTVTVTQATNNAPELSWTTATCLTEGVRPQTGAKNAYFEFRVKYSDVDGQCPPTAGDIRVVVNGTPYNLDQNDGGSCTTGRVYYTSVPISATGNLNYYFTASDGISAATGPPTSNKQVNVVDTEFKVKPTSGSGWYTSIQSAINASTDPATILVYPNADFSPATYTGIVSIASKNNRSLKSVCGADSTIIDAGNNGTAITFDTSTNAELEGFTVKNGNGVNNGNNGGGIYIMGGAAPEIKNCKITNNIVSGNGGGIYITGASSGATIENTTISGNSVSGSSSNGGGIYSNSSAGTLSITNSTLNSNSAKNGGALYANGTGSIQITDSGFNGNSATSYHGGAVYLSAIPATITGGSFTSNWAQQSGGAVYAIDANFTFTGATFSENEQRSSSQNGGAIYARGNNTKTITVDKCYLKGNSAAGNGGALYVTNNSSSPTVYLRNSIISGNFVSTNHGGGLFLNLVNTTIVNSTIAGNYTTLDGGGIYCSNTGSTKITNSIVWGNSAGRSNNQIRKHSSGTTTVNYSDIEGGWTGGNGNQDYTDIKFDDYQQAGSGGANSSGSFTVKSGSPVINMGINYDINLYPEVPSDDINGDLRPLGGLVDMGADEKE